VQTKANNLYKPAHVKSINKTGTEQDCRYFLKLEGQLTKPEARCIREMTTGILKTTSCAGLCEILKILLIS
jgi:hypothetical protein